MSVTVSAPTIPAGTAVEAYRLSQVDVERRELREPIPSAPAASGVLDASQQVTLSGLTEGEPYVLVGVVDEEQTVTVSATGGTFKLTFSGQQTGAIAYNASAATVLAALEGLSNIDVGDVEVTGSAGGPWTIKFLGQYAGTNVSQMTSDATSLTGGAGTATVATSVSGSKAGAGGIERYVTFTGA